MTGRSFVAAACAALLVTSTDVAAFSPMANNNKVSTTSLGMSADSRRDFLNRVATTSAVVAAGLGAGVMPANAIGGGLSKVNAKLASFGVPTISALPGGFTPLAAIYGKGANRFPLLVSYVHPSDWVVTLPSNDANGEDGTIQAGEYAKGDTATFFLYADPGNVKNIGEQPKSFFQESIIKAISQKGNNVYQNFKVTKVVPTTTDYKGQEYVLVDFKYELLTGAGFEVDRVGVASVTSVGDAVEVLWCASTRQRYKKTEDTLRTMASSFRVYADGLSFSDELL